MTAHDSFNHATLVPSTTCRYVFDVFSACEE